MIINVVLLIFMYVGYLLAVRNSSELAYDNEYACSITAIVGRGFSRAYPTHIFADGDWNYDERYKVALRTSDDKKLFSNTWISLDPTGENIIGFPMEGNEGEFTYLLRAKNREGRVKKRKIRITVLADSVVTIHKVSMKLKSGFREFIRDLNYRFLFASVIADYLQRNGIKTYLSDIWITSIQTQGFKISWALSAHNKNSCSEVLTKTLPELLIRNGKPHPNLSQKLHPYFTISFLSYTSDVCAKTGRTDAQIQKRNLIIGPVLIIIIMIGLSSPIFIAYLIRRGRRKREFRRAADVRHVYSNGVAISIAPGPERNSEGSKSQEDLSHRMQYRWSPDMTNRVAVQIPSFPPPRPRLGQIESQYSSMESSKSAAWHGLPTEQCAESNSIQLANIVHSISQSATTLKSYFMSSNDRDSESDGTAVIPVEGDSFSIKSEGSKIFETAMKKMSSFVNGSYFSAPTLIRISKIDVNSEGMVTRRSSIETGNSSFELSIVSSDQPTPSQVSSGVNSFDTEAIISTASFSQDESFSEDVIMSTRDDENIQEKDFKDSAKSSANQISAPCKTSPSKKVKKALSGDKGNEEEAEEGEISTPLRKTSIRGSLQRLPTVQGLDTDREQDKNEDGKSDLLHPWYRDQANVRIQQNKKGTTAQYYITKVAKTDKTAQRKILQNEIIYECHHDEGFDSPTMV